MKMPARQRGRFTLLQLAGAIGAVVAIEPAAVQAQLSFLNTWGSTGSGTSEFNSPTGLTVAPDGTVYVTDQNNQRVEYFSSTGTYLGEFGVSGTGVGGGQFSNPSGVAVNASGTVYVADFRNDDVQLFSPNGTYQSVFGAAGSGNGDFEGPDGLAIGPTGLVYVTDQEDNRVEIFSSTGAFQSAFGSAGANNGQFNGPANLAVSSTGLVYVPDYENNRVEIFSASGIFQSSFGTAGTANGDFEGPLGVGVGPTGLVYVADDGNDRIEVFNSAGVFQSSFGVTGTGNGQFQAPFDVSVNPTGMVYVLDGANNRVQRLFDPESWTSGTDSFTNSAVGPTSATVGIGGLLGNSLTLNSSMGLVIGSSTTINSGASLSIAGGSFSTGGLSDSGTLSYHSGSFSVGGSNMVVAAGAILEADDGGLLTVSSTTTIDGEISLDGGANFTSNVTGIANGGLLAVGQATVTEATTTALSVSSGGELRLTNPVSSIVSATTVSNSGLIDGSGQINATLSNTSTGQVSVALGQNLEITGSGNTNAGAIQLSGGAIHITQGLANSSGGIIEGFGSLRVDGGLTNDSGGTLAFAGSTSVTGQVNNLSGGLIHLSGNSPNVFFSPVSNAGTLTIDAGASGTFYGPYTGSGPVNNFGSVYFNANSVAGPITGGGSLNLGTAAGVANLQLSLNAGPSVESSLNIGPGSTLDVTNNPFHLSYGATDPVSSISSYLASGYNNGAWNGMGIKSSAVAALNAGQSALIYSVGYADGADGIVNGLASGQIEILPTLAGDAKLQGDVVFGDFQLLSQYFGQSGSWDEGNFAYGSTVNFGDFQLLSQNFGASDSALTSGELASLNGFAAQFGEDFAPNVSGVGYSLASVPEPAATGLLAVTSIGFLARRRLRLPRRETHPAHRF